MARSFNGSSDGIQMGNVVPFGNASVWSASAWIFPTVQNSFERIIADRVNLTKFEMFTLNGAVGAYNGFFFNAYGSPTANAWNSAVVTCSASALISYVNGSFAGTDPQDYRTGANAAETLSIGNNSTNNFEAFGGRLADVALWDAVLTVGEALALSKGARPKNIRPQSLRGYWPLDGLVSPEPELSGNAFNGTVTGAAFAAGPPVSMFTPCRPAFLTPSLVTTVFRKTLSPIGTRTGSRQTWAA